MLHEIRMPEFGADMAEADLVQWLVSAGDRVTQGDLIAEFETDKSTVEYEAPVSGVVTELCVPAPTAGVQVGDLIARIESSDAEEETAPEEAVEETAAEPVEARQEPSPAAAAAPEAEPLPPAPEAEDEAAPPNEEVSATALARRIAARDGVDLTAVEPTGVGGRVTKADVEAAALSAEEPTADHRVPLSRMRRTIANRMVEAKREMPHFYLEVDCRADDLLAVRKRLNAGLTDASISLNDLCVAAAARALRDVPAANVAFRGDSIERFSSCDIAVAVATDEGLITPVLRDAANLGVLDVANQLRDLVERARSGRLAPTEYQGGFTLSNLGMFGITAVWPIVNPPHACILGVGAVERVPVVDGDRVVPGAVMRCTLSADHRAVDGAVGAQLLARFRRYVEDPRAMIL